MPTLEWPSDGSPLSFDQITTPILAAIRQAFTLARKDRRKSIKWTGPEIGKGEQACSLLAAERLKATNLVYAENDQGRDALEEIVGLAVQLGMEQGRRVGKSSITDLLDEAYGAIFTVKIGFDRTEVHTQAGLTADPMKTLAKGIEALASEMSRIERCPRERAISAVRKENDDGE